MLPLFVNSRGATKPVNILIHSNAPFSQSGYGGQTEIFSRLLSEAGHSVKVSAFYGLKGQKLQWGAIEILPGSFHDYGEDILVGHARHYQPDALVTLIDVWVYGSAILREAGVTAWTPVDHDPIPPAVADKLHACKHVWAMSRFGEQQMKRAGITPFYVPHGVDSEQFFPADRAAARAALGLPADQFVAVCVAANKGFPSRKSLDRLVKAWARFAQRHPGAVLWLHSNPLPVHSGLDLERMAAFYGCPPGSILFPDTYKLVNGDYGTLALNALYNAADVMVLPSAGGGFEIPLIEAQMAGCPVITTKVTAMTELIGPSSYGIDIDPFDGMQYTLQDSEQANVLPSQIVAGLEWAFEQRGNAKLRADAQNFAQQYEARHVLNTYMLPALDAQRDLEATRQARTAARVALRDSNKVPENMAEIMQGGPVEWTPAMDAEARKKANLLTHAFVRRDVAETMQPATDFTLEQIAAIADLPVTSPIDRLHLSDDELQAIMDAERTTPTPAALAVAEGETP